MWCFRPLKNQKIEEHDIPTVFDPLWNLRDELKIKLCDHGCQARSNQCKSRISKLKIKLCDLNGK